MRQSHHLQGVEFAVGEQLSFECLPYLGGRRCCDQVQIAILRRNSPPDRLPLVHPQAEALRTLPTGLDAGTGEANGAGSLGHALSSSIRVHH